MTELTPKADKTIQELRAAGALPSPQGVALAIMEATRDENVSLEALARLIRPDPALSGRLIRAANGIRQGIRRPVASITDAVTVLGISAVRQLALGFSLISNYRGGLCRSFEYELFWSRSLLTAIATPAFAAHVRVAAPDELFVCGLLGRIGQLGLATAHPAEYSLVLDAHRAAAGDRLATREAAAFGVTALQLSAAMLEDWGVTRHLVDPVRHHEEERCSHFPEGSRGATLRNVLHFSAFFAESCMTAETTRRRMLPQLFLLATQIGLTAESVLAIGDRVVKEWREWAPLLEVQTQDIKSYATLAAELPEVAPTPAPAADRMRVLVIDDDRRITAMLGDALGAAYDVYLANDGRSGISRALEVEPHIIITDWDMPDMDGTEMCRALREVSIGRGIYMVIMTSNTDDDRLVKAFEAGVDDVVQKPFRVHVLQARLRAAQRVWSLREEIERDRGEIRRFASELVVANRRLQDNALNDALTGLPNRRYAMDRIQQEWSAAARGGYPLSCVLIEVDRLKHINDTVGYDAGDAILKEIAARLRSACRARDVLCRLGGGDFLVICPDSTADSALQCARRLEERITLEGYAYRGAPMTLSATTGIASAKGLASPADLIMAADHALHAAQESRGNPLTVMTTGRHSAAA